MTSSLGKAGGVSFSPSPSKPKDGGTSSPSSSATAAPPSMAPVRPNPSPLAQAARHVLPGLQVAVFLFRFRDLVADPVATMASNLPIAAGLQIAYVLLCLPAAGSQAAKAARKHLPGEKKKKSGGGAIGGAGGAGGDGAGPNSIVAAILSLVLTALLTPVLHAAMVLLGAPVLTHGAHTSLCAAYLGLFALFPAFYAHGVDSAAWLALAGLRAPVDEVLGGLAGSALGAWLGAVPIPLDWDRDWQRWPVTVLCGVYAGYVVGRLVGGTVLFGKRF